MMVLEETTDSKFQLQMLNCMLLSMEYALQLTYAQIMVAFQRKLTNVIGADRIAGVSEDVTQPVHN